uniref:Serine/threonine-protein phosphatase n=1 Tax=Romanomermis culicivorax TaxID=13658 RepID=A0A915I4K0_ROMCU
MAQHEKKIPYIPAFQFMSLRSAPRPKKNPTVVVPVAKRIAERQVSKRLKGIGPGAKRTSSIRRGKAASKKDDDDEEEENDEEEEEEKSKDEKENPQKEERKEKSTKEKEDKEKSDEKTEETSKEKEIENSTGKQDKKEPEVEEEDESDRTSSSSRSNRRSHRSRSSRRSSGRSDSRSKKRRKKKKKDRRRNRDSKRSRSKSKRKRRRRRHRRSSRSPPLRALQSARMTLPDDTPLQPINIDSIIERLTELVKRRPRDARKRPCVVTKNEAKQVLLRLRKILLEQSTLIEIDPPVNIVADLHGQYSDLLRLLLHVGHPPNSRYMFLGDYVDRGSFGVELFILVASLKIKYPGDVYLLRGNHECRFVNLVYGFYVPTLNFVTINPILDEIKKKFNSRGEDDQEMWDAFMETFDCLPIAGLIGGKILGMHGGLSPDLTDFDQIRNIMRPCDVPSYGIMCDLLWADPELGMHGWAESTRGISYTFGEDVVRKFCQTMQISMIVRGHQNLSLTCQGKGIQSKTDLYDFGVPVEVKKWDVSVTV